MSDSLRSSLIRLAHSKPELREHLLPLLKREAATDPMHKVQDLYKKNEQNVKLLRNTIAKMKSDRSFHALKSHRDLDKLIEELDMLKRVRTIEDYFKASSKISDLILEIEHQEREGSPVVENIPNLRDYYKLFKTLQVLSKT